MSLRISASDLAKIYEHGEASFPEECCGVMIGRSATQGAPATVEEILSAQNEREDENRHNRFLISPRALLDAQRAAREKGLEVLGYYHSHPDHPARPSDFDRDHAWPATSYLIVSIMSGRVADCRSWLLKSDRSAFDEESVEDLVGNRVAIESPVS